MQTLPALLAPVSMRATHRLLRRVIGRIAGAILVAFGGLLVAKG
jgi:hypothetical protein